MHSLPRRLHFAVVDYDPSPFMQALPRRLHFAVVDEVDSVLIDESRNPMIISTSVAQNVVVVRLVDTVGDGGGGEGWEAELDNEGILRVDASLACRFIVVHAMARLSHLCDVPPPPCRLWALCGAGSRTACSRWWPGTAPRPTRKHAW